MRILVVMLSLVLVVALVPACGEEADSTDTQPGATPPTTDPGAGGPAVPDVAPDPGKATLAASCVECHGLEKVTAVRKTADEWADQVTMCTEGNPLDEEAAKELVDYLARTQGR